VASVDALPNPEWKAHWERIICDEGLKSRLLNFAVFCLTSRQQISQVGIPSHGFALLTGPPGTGQTTLAYGLANRAAEELVARDLAERVLFVVIDPHALPSEMLGASQRATSQLFERAIPDIADEGSPVVVLFDEIEAVAVNRRQASAGTNPIDVHRASQAVLTGIDTLARRCRSVLIIGTTNHTEAVDDALVSRADLVEHMGKPPVDAAYEMLADALRDLALAAPIEEPVLREIAAECVERGADARQIRKLVLRALIAGDIDVALSPSRLASEQLRSALSNSVFPAASPAPS
jgi:SpoVK/Ycf46/Vps4 family AAA+-type ATPase